MNRCNHTILIICEGEMTEPSFFNSLKDENKLDNTNITIHPEPRDDEEEQQNNKKHKRKRKIRKLKKPVHKHYDLKIEKAPLPLNWVRTGKRELEDGTYDEVWVVFDHDNFPARKEAFKEAQDNIHIAYSSRSFEYYFLMHFERIYKSFNETDCKFKQEDKKNKIFIRCGSNKYPDKDCNGKKCINGYAHAKKYWENTDKKNAKNIINFYNKIKDKIEVGYINSAWIRFKSELNQSETSIYNRNPYLTTDKLVKRLLSSNTEYCWIKINKKYRFENIEIEVNNSKIIIKNVSEKTIIIQKDAFQIITKNKQKYFGEKKIISIGKSAYYNKESFNWIKAWFKFSYNHYIIMFEN